jgi:hypothetical protein
MTTKEHTINTLSVNLESDAFLSGFVAGQAGVTGRFDTSGPLIEAKAVDLVRNLTEIAVEGWLSEEQLKYDVGLLLGWCLREAGTIPYLIPVS